MVVASHVEHFMALRESCEEMNSEEIEKIKKSIESNKHNNQYYMVDSQMFDKLVDEVFNHIVAYGRRFKSKKKQYLRDWVHQQLAFLDNEHFKFDDYGANECAYLIFHGLTEFPKCSICGKVLDDPDNFQNIFCGFMTCSKECGELLRQKSFVNTCLDRYGVCHYASNKERYEQRCDAMEKKYGVRNVFMLDSTKKTIKKTKKERHGDENYVNVELMRQHRYEKYDGKWEPEEAKEKRRQSFIDHYGVDHNMKSEEGLKAYEDSIERKYGSGIRNVSQAESVKQKKIETCRKNLGVDYPLQSKSGQMHFQETCLNLYGVPFPMQNSEIHKKSKSKYFYNEQWFDSAPEIAFYIWLKDNNIEFEHEPSPGLEYSINGKIHRYFPDFKVGDMYFEIKGDYFFNKDGNLIDPYNSLNNNIAYEKYKCMIENNVIILKSAEYKIFELYVKQKYGCHYLKQFKNKEIKK